MSVESFPKLIDSRRPAHCGCHHSLGWDPEIYTDEPSANFHPSQISDCEWDVASGFKAPLPWLPSMMNCALKPEPKWALYHSLALPGSCTTATERQPQQASFLVEVFQGQYFARDIFYPWNKLNSVLLLMLACVFDSNWCNMLFFCVFPAWSVLGKEVGLVVTK